MKMHVTMRGDYTPLIEELTIDRAIFLAIALLLVFSSPLTDWWSDAALPWFFPYMFWFILLIAMALFGWRGRDDD